MFVAIKNLTAYMDRNIQLVEEAKASKEQHSPEVYNGYMKRMKDLLTGQVDKLKELSCDKRLIPKYEAKVDKLFKDWEESNE